jgi:hypothetical protein
MNPILDELHAVREKLLLDAGETLDALVDRLQAEERNSDRPRYRTPGTMIGIGARIAPGPLPHHPACGSAPGGSFPRSQRLPDC